MRTKSTLLSLASVAVLATAGGTAFADGTWHGKSQAMTSAEVSREQVRDELEQARRNGELHADYTMERRWRDVNPYHYGRDASDPPGAKSREQVRQELADAQRRGEFPYDASLERAANEMNPYHYQSAAERADSTRDRVRQELADARRTGEIERYRYWSEPGDVRPDPGMNR